MSVEENIKNMFLNPTSPLFEEPENLLKQEVREAALYNAIITAIATGASRMAEISTKVGEDSSVYAAYLKNLTSLGLLRKEFPYGEKTSRKSLYMVDDNMFRFWQDEAKYFIITRRSCSCLRKLDLQRDAWKLQQKWEMWRW